MKLKFYIKEEKNECYPLFLDKISLWDMRVNKITI